MFFRLSGLAVRLPTSWAMRSVAHGVGAVLAFSFSCSRALSTPLNCLEGGGRVICADPVKKTTEIVTVVQFDNQPHPATVKGRHPVKNSRVVQPIPLDIFLPSYFGVRRSQLGYDIQFPKTKAPKDAP